MRIRRAALVILAGVVVAGCETKGQNLPRQEAEQRFPLEPIEFHTVGHPDSPPQPARPPIMAFDRAWMPHGGAQRIPAHALRSVGSTQGIALFAATWDEPPYSRLLTPLGEDLWLEYRELPGGQAVTGAAPPAGPEAPRADPPAAGPESAAAGEAAAPQRH
jgi:hypothetical protein